MKNTMYANEMMYSMVYMKQKTNRKSVTKNQYAKYPMLVCLIRGGYPITGPKPQKDPKTGRFSAPLHVPARPTVIISNIRGHFGLRE